MMDWMRMLAAAGLLAGCAVKAAPATPVCGDAGVLRQVEESIRARGRAMVLEVPPIGEVSTDSVISPALAHCAVRGHTVGYDTNRYGASPVNEPFTIRYTVEMRRNGLFVRIE